MSAKICQSCLPKECELCNKVIFPVPPVCTAYWHSEQWKNYIYIHGVDKEPKEIKSGFGIWKKTDKTNKNGDALYRLQGT